MPDLSTVADRTSNADNLAPTYVPNSGGLVDTFYDHNSYMRSNESGAAYRNQWLVFTPPTGPSVLIPAPQKITFPFTGAPFPWGQSFSGPGIESQPVDLFTVGKKKPGKIRLGSYLK